MGTRVQEQDRPEWACPNWGQWEHDWLDCPEYLAGYEKTLEREPEEGEEYVR